MNTPSRKQNRLQNYNYSQSGAYFITICTQNHAHILCDIVGDGALDVPKTDKICAGDGESRELRWFSKDELLTQELKPHIKNTALAVLDYITKKAHF